MAMMTSPADIDTLNQRAQLFFREKNTEAQALAEAACIAAIRIGYQEGYLCGLINHGRAYTLLGGYVEAIPLFEHVLSIAEEKNHALLIADCLQEIARAHFTLGEYGSALQYWSRCLDVSNHAHAHETWLRTLIGLGQIYLAHGDAATALAHHRWAQCSWKEGQDPSLYAAACINTGVDLYQLQQFDEALEILAQARGATIEQLAEIDGILGLIHLGRGHVEAAQQALQSALRINQIQRNTLGMATNYLALGRLAIMQQDFSEATCLLEKALRQAEAMGTQQLLFQIEMALAQTYEQREEWQQALQHFKRYHDLQWEIQRQVSPHKLQAMEMQLEIEKTRVENLQLRRKHASERQERYRVERMAGEDVLTGLLNRRGLEQSTETLLPSENEPVSLLMIDVDHFKSINDNCGHETGDKVLRQVAALLKSGCRQGDLVSRWGGEEFTILLQNRDGPQGAEVAERLRHLVESWTWERIAPGQVITISAGVTQFHPGDDLNILVQRADAKLYQAKHAGRNRVIL